MTDIANIIAQRHQMIADFEANREQIAARKIHNSLWMLIWKHDGSSLFVGRRPKALETSPTGFNWAITFQTEKDAQAYVQRTNIRNGKGEQPVPVDVAEAREIALANVDGVLSTLRAMDQASA